MSDVLTTRKGALWIQPDGPNTPVYFLGCHDLGDVEDSAGESEPIRCMNTKGGWKTVGQKVSPPDMVATTVDALMFPEADYLEKVGCNFTLFAMLRAGGPPDIFDNYSRAVILNKARVSTTTFTNLVHHEEENESMMSIGIEAWPPVIKTGKVTVRRLTSTETESLNCVTNVTLDLCKPSKDVVAVGNGTVYASANVLLSSDKGITFSSSSADPFSTAENIMSVAVVAKSATEKRIIVALEAPSAGQGEIAFSDDDGATWTTVNIGGATDGHGAVDSGALFALDYGHVWLASALGYVYFSEDGGASWTVQSSGLTVQDLHAVRFEDQNNGMAVGGAGAVLVTTNGGDTWSLAVAPGSDALTCVSKSGEFWWVGDDGGGLFYSNDDGESWTQRTGFEGSGIAAIADIAFNDELIGYMIANTGSLGAVLRTINGGYTWETLTTPANSTLNSISLCDYDTAFVVGNSNGGTAVILRITRD